MLSWLNCWIRTCALTPTRCFKNVPDDCPSLIITNLQLNTEIMSASHKPTCGVINIANRHIPQLNTDIMCAGHKPPTCNGKHYQQVLELMQMHPKERLRRVILIASRYSTGLKLENYYFFTFSFSWPEVGKLFHIYFFFTFSFSWPEVGKLFHIYFFTFSQTEVGNYSVVTFLLFLDQKLENYSIFRWLSARLQ